MISKSVYAPAFLCMFEIKYASCVNDIRQCHAVKRFPCLLCLLRYPTEESCIRFPFSPVLRAGCLAHYRHDLWQQIHKAEINCAFEQMRQAFYGDIFRQQLGESVKMLLMGHSIALGATNTYPLWSWVVACPWNNQAVSSRLIFPLPFILSFFLWACSLPFWLA